VCLALAQVATGNPWPPRLAVQDPLAFRPDPGWELGTHGEISVSTPLPVNLSGPVPGNKRAARLVGHVRQP